MLNSLSHSLSAAHAQRVPPTLLFLFPHAGGELAASTLNVLPLALADGGGDVFAEEYLLKGLDPGRVGSEIVGTGKGIERNQIDFVAKFVQEPGKISGILVTVVYIPDQYIFKGKPFPWGKGVTFQLIQELGQGVSGCYGHDFKPGFIVGGVEGDGETGRMFFPCEAADTVDNAAGG